MFRPQCIKYSHHCRSCFFHLLCYNSMLRVYVNPCRQLSPPTHPSPFVSGSDTKHQITHVIIGINPDCIVSNKTGFMYALTCGDVFRESLVSHCCEILSSGPNVYTWQKRHINMMTTLLRLMEKINKYMCSYSNVQFVSSRAVLMFCDIVFNMIVKWTKTNN